MLDTDDVVATIHQARAAQRAGPERVPPSAVSEEAIERALARAYERAIARAIERVRRVQRRRIFRRG